MTEELPLLIGTGLEKIKQVEYSFHSPIAITLLRAHERGASRQGKGLMNIIADTTRLIDIGPKNSNTFTFLPKGKKPAYNEAGELMNTNRQATTYAKLARTLLETTNLYHEMDEVRVDGKWWRFEPHSGVALKRVGDKTQFKLIKEEARIRTEKVPIARYHDKLYEAFSNQMKTVTEGIKDFILVKGKDILQWYSTANYWGREGATETELEREGATLWSSCMNNVSPEYLQMYVNSPDCQLLVGLKDGKAIGRALVWNTNRGVFMDRIYYQQDHYASAFTTYAMEKGWMYRKNNDTSSYTEVMVEGNGVYSLQKNTTLRVNGVVKPKHIPYCDTFKYLGEGFLTNDRTSDWKYQLESTNGNYMGEQDQETHEEDETTITCSVTGEVCQWADMRYTPVGYVRGDLCIPNYEGDWIVGATSVQLADGSYADGNDDQVVELYDGRKGLREECEFLASRAAWFPMSELTWSNGEKGWVLYERASA